MKLGGGLNYVTGPMGSGKSLYGVRRIREYVMSGRYVVTNVELYPWAFDLMAKRAGRFLSSAERRRIAARLQSFYIYEADLHEAMRYRVPGKGEARALFIWDETHNDLNNRNWRDNGRGEILEWATQLRKLGYVGFLLSQHHENTDAALRRVCNWLVRLRNQRESHRVFGLRATPWPLFLAEWYMTNVPGSQGVKPTKVERYFLDWHRTLYDTHGLFHGLDQADDDELVIRLPEGGRLTPLASAPAIGEAEELAA